jgi:hypothetical protein
MGVLKLVSLLFPFVRDMILGDSSLKYALKTNKLRVLLLFFLMFCFAWTIYSVPRIVEMAAEQVRLEHQYQVLEKKQHEPLASDMPTIRALPPLPESQPAVEADNNNNDPDHSPTPASQAMLPARDPESEFKARQRAWLDSLEDDESKK